MRSRDLLLASSKGSDGSIPRDFWTALKKHRDTFAWVLGKSGRSRLHLQLRVILMQQPSDKPLLDHSPRVAVQQHLAHAMLRQLAREEADEHVGRHRVELDTAMRKKLYLIGTGAVFRKRL